MKTDSGRLLQQEPQAPGRPEPSGYVPVAWSDYRMWKLARRAVIFVLGLSVVLVGVAMIVLPGPAFLVIPLGLAILGTEFLWARQILKKLKERLAKAVGPAKNDTGPA